MHTQDIIIMIDESGSMSSMGVEPIQAINAFINDQKRNLPDNIDSNLTLFKFNNRVTKVVDNVSLRDVADFSDFCPSGGTALFDAIGCAISHMHDSENVICVILTDGVENASHDYTKRDIIRLIEKMEREMKWTFIYLAANQNAFSTGSQFGMSAGRCATFDTQSGGIISAAKTVSNSITRHQLSSRGGETSEITIPEYIHNGHVKSIPIPHHRVQSIRRDYNEIEEAIAIVRKRLKNNI